MRRNRLYHKLLKREWVPLVVRGWDGNPTLLTKYGGVFPRDYELITHKDFYPNWPSFKWPVNPKTGDLCNKSTRYAYHYWEV